MSKRRVYVGIDNGALSGAMCALCPETGAVIEYALMPNIEHDGKKEADPVELIRWLSGYDCIAIGIEACPKHAGSAASMRSMSMSFGICHGAMMVAQLPVCRVTVHEWQKKMAPQPPVSDSPWGVHRRSPNSYLRPGFVGGTIYILLAAGSFLGIIFCLCLPDKGITLESTLDQSKSFLDKAHEESQFTDRT